jgi:hypothetical protein
MRSTVSTGSCSTSAFDWSESLCASLKHSIALLFLPCPSLSYPLPSMSPSIAQARTHTSLPSQVLFPMMGSYFIQVQNFVCCVCYACSMWCQPINGVHSTCAPILVRFCPKPSHTPPVCSSTWSGMRFMTMRRKIV